MSKHDKIAKLKEYIKNVVIKELEKDEELEEVSTTATAGIDGTGTGHYDTPHAFSSGSAVGHKSPEVGGYKKVNERLSVDPRKVYGGTGAKQGMVLTAQKGLKKILDLSKKNPSNVFLVSDDNYTNFGPYYVKNGKVAKYTVANPNYDLQKNKVRSLKVPSDVILKFTINESINESYTRMFIEIGKAINASKADDLNAIKDLGEEYDIGRVLYMARTNPKALKKAVDDRVKEKKQFLTKTKKLKEVTKQEVNALRNLVKGIGNLKKDFSKATYIGDKELRKKDYNKHYETLLDAEKAMVKLMQLFKNKEMLGEGRYHDWRNDESLTPKQKVGKSVREIRDALNELDKTVKMNLKLKTELNMSSQDYWKNTHKALTKISERLVKMANKIGNLK
jgi:hypothetical protein